MTFRERASGVKASKHGCAVGGRPLVHNTWSDLKTMVAIERGKVIKEVRSEK